MNWKSHPTESGFYWFRPLGEPKEFAVVIEYEADLNMVSYTGSDCPHFCFISGEFTVPEGKYWGPLEVPEA